MHGSTLNDEGTPSLMVTMSRHEGLDGLMNLWERHHVFKSIGQQLNVYMQEPWEGPWAQDLPAGREMHQEL